MAKVKNEFEPKPIDMEGVKDASMQILIGEAENSPTAIMRRFKVEAGGYTPKHTHDYEHVVFVLSGKGTLYASNGEFDLQTGTHLIVDPNEIHQFKADCGEQLEFLCIIPKI